MKTIGVVGAGQLARMLALAGFPLGLRFVFLDPEQEACAAPLGEHILGRFDDHEQLSRFAERAHVVTYEFENVPDESIKLLAKCAPAFPNTASLVSARDRLKEKRLFQQLDIPTPPFAVVNSRADLDQSVASIGFPAILKTRTLGYDGKGQAIVRRPEDLDFAWARLGGAPLILEKFLQFQREVSVLGVRGRTGKMAFYPLTENVHHKGILRASRSCPGDQLETQAQGYVQLLLDHLGYVGVLALEFFQNGDTLLANEMAPRVHNSGHWTIEGAETSQFENHLRAILGLPLGGTAAVGHSAMINIIGELPELAQVLAIPGAHIHLYGKTPRPGRKLGHVTVQGSNEQEFEAGVERLLRVVCWRDMTEDTS